MAKVNSSKSRKAQFFIISAFTIVTFMFFMSRWIEPYTIIDTSSIAAMEEPFMFNNIMEKIHETINTSKNADELTYNFQELKNFIEEYGTSKNLNIKLNISDINVTTWVEESGETVSADIMLIIDRSGSMTVPPSKLADAKDAAMVFVDLLDPTKDISGLVSFHSWAVLDQPLTDNQILVKEKINGLVVGTNTNIKQAIDFANIELAANGRSNVNHVEILLTDGMYNEPQSDPDPWPKVIDAKNQNIKIYTIGLGSDAVGPFLQNVADTTGGKYYYAPSSSDLEAIYIDIAKEIFYTRRESISISYCLNLISPNANLEACRNITSSK